MANLNTVSPEEVAVPTDIGMPPPSPSSGGRTNKQYAEAVLAGAKKIAKGGLRAEEDNLKWGGTIAQYAAAALNPVGVTGLAGSVGARGDTLGKDIRSAAQPPPEPGPPPVNRDLATVPASQGIASGAPDWVAQENAQPQITTQAIPAHEVDLYGPSAHAALERANRAASGTVARVGERNQQNAALERNMYAEQERKALDRQDVQNASIAQRETEFKARAQDFDQAAKEAAAAAHVDPGRFWSSRSTGQQISGLIGVALGGFLHGATGRDNPALTQIQKSIDLDVRAQEFAYQGARDKVNAKQTAFSMAMQRYGNLDAAKAFATAAGLQAANAQISKMGARWKGTDAANRADEAGAMLQGNIAKQVIEGTKYVQAATVQTGGPMQLTQPQQFQLEMKRLELKEKANEAEAKASEKRDEQDEQGQKYISKELTTAQIPELRSALDDIRGAIPDIGDIPGYGPVANRLYRNPNTLGVPGPLLHKGIYGSEASTTQQRVSVLKNSLIHKITGASVGQGGEEQRLKAQIENAESSDDLREAVRAVDSAMKKQEANIKAGTSGRAAAAYDRRASQEKPREVPGSFK